jgi:hypothetical protein
MDMAKGSSIVSENLGVPLLPDVPPSEVDKGGPSFLVCKGQSTACLLEPVLVLCCSSVWS